MEKFNQEIRNANYTFFINPEVVGRRISTAVDEQVDEHSVFFWADVAQRVYSKKNILPSNIATLVIDTINKGGKPASTLFNDIFSETPTSQNDAPEEQIHQELTVDLLPGTEATVSE